MDGHDGNGLKRWANVFKFRGWLTKIAKADYGLLSLKKSLTLDVLGSFSVWAKVRHDNFSVVLTKCRQNPRDIAPLYKPLKSGQKRKRLKRFSLASKYSLCFFPVTSMLWLHCWVCVRAFDLFLFSVEEEIKRLTLHKTDHTSWYYLCYEATLIVGFSCIEFKHWLAQNMH